MNITNDLLIGGIIFLAIILFRSIISNHRGGFAGGIIIIVAGFLLTDINNLYGKLVIVAGFILILISLIEHKKSEEDTD